MSDKGLRFHKVKSAMHSDSFIAFKRDVHEFRNEIASCPVCNGNIQDRVISIYRALIVSLYKIYVMCGEKQIHEFQMKDVKQFMSKSDYNRFNDLVRFGGIVYRPDDKDGKKKKGLYGINMERAQEFFQGKRKIPVQIVRDQINDETIDRTDVTVYDIPEMKEFMTTDGLYDHTKVLPMFGEKD